VPGELPLAGLKILDFMWAMAGPAATRVLADYGATVVRVESERKLEVARTLQPFVGGVSGAESSGLFMNMNTGKLGLALDLSKPESRDVILDLVRWADVVCESFSPKAMKAWGLDYDQLREVNPQVIMLSSCLMGQTGPMAHFAGFGNLAAAISGFHNVTGWADRDPSGPFSAYTDYVSPRITVAVLLAALEHRRRTGQGQYIDFSQAEATLHLLGPALLDYGRNRRILGRHGNRDPYMAPHGAFPCIGRDRWVSIAVDSDAAWRELCAEMGRDDLAGLGTEERLRRVDELEELVAAWTAPQHEGDVERRVQARGIPAHVVANSPESWVDPQLAHRGHFVTVDHALHGEVTVEGTRWLFSRTPPTSYRAAPTLGQDAFAILSELLDYDVDRIADLAAAELLE
jgi:benzylsuccinate CoA-transferase BbsF subunit